LNNHQKSFDPLRIFWPTNFQPNNKNELFTRPSPRLEVSTWNFHQQVQWAPFIFQPPLCHPARLSIACDCVYIPSHRMFVDFLHSRACHLTVVLESTKLSFPLTHFSHITVSEKFLILAAKKSCQWRRKNWLISAKS
jgi:hypothetical protein